MKSFYHTKYKCYMCSHFSNSVILMCDRHFLFDCVLLYWPMANMFISTLYSLLTLLDSSHTFLLSFQMLAPPNGHGYSFLSWKILSPHILYVWLYISLCMTAIIPSGLADCIVESRGVSQDLSLIHIFSVLLLSESPLLE